MNLTELQSGNSLLFCCILSASQLVHPVFLSEYFSCIYFEFVFCFCRRIDFFSPQYLSRLLWSYLMTRLLQSISLPFITTQYSKGRLPGCGFYHSCLKKELVTLTGSFMSKCVLEPCKPAVQSKCMSSYLTSGYCLLALVQRTHLCTCFRFFTIQF